MLDPQVVKSVMGPRTLSAVCELLWYNCSPVCESPPRKLYSGTTSIMATSFKRTCATRCTSQVCCCQSLSPHGRPWQTHASSGDPQTPKGRSDSASCGIHCSVPSVLVCTRFVSALQAALVGTRFDFKCNCTPPTVLLWLLLCPWSWSIFLWWVPKLSCQSLLNS